mmetsp:Transcript_30329/g.64911  ORF Transcript_30329/g.64911 Transcript_30329/m.64911 type:complete len:439 (-) Transcript_30329:75-1391(-)
MLFLLKRTSAAVPGVPAKILQRNHRGSSTLPACWTAARFQHVGKVFWGSGRAPERKGNWGAAFATRITLRRSREGRDGEAPPTHAMATLVAHRVCPAAVAAATAPRLPRELQCGGETIAVVDYDDVNADDRGERASGLLPDFDIGAFAKRLVSESESSRTTTTSGSSDNAWTILAARQLVSTQNVLHDNAGALPDRCVVVADTQTQGKGRAGNTWVSPPGCLMCSVLCDIRVEGHKLPLLQYATTLAVVQALEALCGGGNVGGEAAEKFARIKWPNDIYVNGTKAGGVLCQTVYKGSGKFQLIAGIGLNVDNETDAFLCVNQVLRSEKRAEIRREDLLALILPRLTECYSYIGRTGGIQDEYYRYWLHSGQKLTVKADATVKEDASLAQEAAGEKVVTIRGLSREGMLVGEDEAGRAIELYPDGNSLDLMKGLIMRKQ